MRREFAYLKEHRVSVGMHTDVGAGPNGSTLLTFAFAICGWRDQFDKKKSRKILNGRIDKRFKTGKRIRNTFEVFYEGEKPRNEVFYPVLDALRDSLLDGAAALMRDHSAIRNARFNVAAAVSSPKVLVSL